jgi:hypothetical protein
VLAILNLPSDARTVASSTFLLSNFSSITCNANWKRQDTCEIPTQSGHCVAAAETERVGARHRPAWACWEPELRPRLASLSCCRFLAAVFGRLRCLLQSPWPHISRRYPKGPYGRVKVHTHQPLRQATRLQTAATCLKKKACERVPDMCFI